MSLTIAVLTGRRPDLLAETLASFVACHRDVWEAATRVVFHNTGDRETDRVLDGYRWDDRQVSYGPLLTIGTASQRLLRMVADAGTDHVLRLEDDWRAHPGRWYDQAVAMLRDVGQVRLRLSHERVLRRCMVCRQPIRWRRHRTGYIAHAHYTHQPSLMRTDDLLEIAGYAHERDAQARFHRHKVGQLVPGVFEHLGVADKGVSLRRLEGAT